MSQPELLTARLRLRPFSLVDVRRVEQLAGEREVAEGCVSIPHPYPSGLAERWIASHETGWQTQQAVVYAITLVTTDELAGSISLVLREERLKEGAVRLTGTMGYWLGKAYWGQGYMSEAVAALLDLAFNEIGIDRVEAEHTVENPASGRVMLKNGLQRINERTSRDPDNHPRQLVCYALDWPEYRNKYRTSDHMN